MMEPFLFFKSGVRVDTRLEDFFSHTGETNY